MNKSLFSLSRFLQIQNIIIPYKDTCNILQSRTQTHWQIVQVRSPNTVLEFLWYLRRPNISCFVLMIPVFKSMLKNWLGLKSSSPSIILYSRSALGPKSSSSADTCKQMVLILPWVHCYIFIIILHMLHCPTLLATAYVFSLSEHINGNWDLKCVVLYL